MSRKILIVTDSLPSPGFKRSGVFAKDDYEFYKGIGIETRILILHRVTFKRRNILRPLRLFLDVIKQCNELRALTKINSDIEFKVYFSLFKPFVDYEDLFIFRNSVFVSQPFDKVIVHSMLHCGLNIGWLRSQFHLSQIVLKEHSDWTKFDHRVYRVCRRKVQSFDAVWANSTCTLEVFKNLFYNSENLKANLRLDYPKFKLYSQPIQKEVGIIRILTVANLIPAKGFREAFDLIDIVDELNIEWHWTIIGNGPLKSELKELARARSYDNIVFVDELEKSELYEYYKNSNVYLQLSYFETFGIAPIEAYSFGNKLIVSPYVTSLLEFGLYEDDNVFSISNVECFDVERLKIFLQSDLNNNYVSKVSKISSIINAY